MKTTSLRSANWGVGESRARARPLLVFAYPKRKFDQRKDNFSFANRDCCSRAHVSRIAEKHPTETSRDHFFSLRHHRPRDADGRRCADVLYARTATYTQRGLSFLSLLFSSHAYRYHCYYICQARIQIVRGPTVLRVNGIITIIMTLRRRRLRAKIPAADLRRPNAPHSGAVCVDNVNCSRTKSTSYTIAVRPLYRLLWLRRYCVIITLLYAVSFLLRAFDIPIRPYCPSHRPPPAVATGSRRDDGYYAIYTTTRHYYNHSDTTRPANCARRGRLDSATNDGTCVVMMRESVVCSFLACNVRLLVAWVSLAGCKGVAFSF